jgi:hypothetical protein
MIIDKGGKPIGIKENATNIEDVCIPTGSGFIYYLDQVVDAMPNIEQYLRANQDKYSLFYSLMQRFATYSAASLANYKGLKLYTKGYTGITNIASEFPPGSPEPPSSDICSVFLPDNTVLQAYLDNTVLKSYSSIDSVPDVTIKYILQSQMSNRLEMPSKFTKVFFNVYGDKSVLDTITDIRPGFMCSNGPVYTSNRILEANLLSCVPGPLLFDKNYSAFAQLLTDANVVLPITQDKRVTLFACNNAQLEASNIRLVVNSSTHEFQQKGDDGLWITLSGDQLITFAQDHIYMGELSESDLNGEGYLPMFSNNYIHYSAKALTGGLNIFNNNTATIVSNTERKNGILFYINNPILTRYRMGQYIYNSDTSLSLFAQLMVKAGYLKPDFKDPVTKYIYPDIGFIEGTGAYYWTLFAPDNAAIKSGIASGSVPDTSVISAPSATKMTALKNFIDYHFIPKTIFDDGKSGSGSFKTKLESKFLTISNNKDDLRITDASGQVVILNHADADHVVRRGVVHKISSVLKNQ